MMSRLLSPVHYKCSNTRNDIAISCVVVARFETREYICRVSETPPCSVESKVRSTILSLILLVDWIQALYKGPHR